jgi:hypothetical protein
MLSEYENYLPYILIFLFIITGIVICTLYIKERRKQEGFINIKGIAKGAFKSGKDAGMAAIKSGGNPKEAFKIMLNTMVTEAYNDSIQEIEEDVSKMDQIRQGVYRMLKSGLSAGYYAYKADASKRDVAKAAITGCVSNIQPMVDEVYNGYISDVDALVSGMDPIKKGIYGMLKAGLTAGFLSYKVNGNRQEAGKAAIDGCSSAMQPLIDAVLATRSPQERAKFEEIKQQGESAMQSYRAGENPLDIAKRTASSYVTPEMRDKVLSKGLEQAGFKPDSPLLLAKLATMSKREQAEFLYKQTGKEGVLYTYGATKGIGGN